MLAASVETNGSLLALIGLLLTILGIVIGAVASVLASRHYYRRAQDKRLSPFISIASSVFGGIDESVRRDLQISYRERKISELYQLEIVIANDGERGISCIEPLSVAFPAGVGLLDCAILHRQPSELRVDVSSVESDSAGGTVIRLPFPVLNKDQFFIVKFLLDGEVDLKKIIFRITAEDLPATIPLQRLPITAYGGEVLNGLGDWIGFAIAGALLLVGLSIGYMILLLQKARPEVFPVPWSAYRWNLLEAMGLIGSALGVLALFGIGVFGFIESIKEVVAKTARRSGLRLPHGLRHVHGLHLSARHAIEIEPGVSVAETDKPKENRP